MKTMDPFPRKVPSCVHIQKFTSRDRAFSDPQSQAEQLPGVGLGDGRGPSGLCWPCWRPLWPSDQCLSVCHSFTSQHCLGFQHLNVLASYLRLVCQPRSCLILSNPTALPWFNCQGVHSPSPQPLASPFFPLPQLQLLCIFKVTRSPGERPLLPRPGPSAPLAPLAPAVGFRKSRGPTHRLWVSLASH